MTDTQRFLILILAVLLVISSGCTEKTGDAASGIKSQHNNTEKNMDSGSMPTTEKQMSNESKETIINGEFQEVDLKVNASGYSPNIIIAQNNIPLRINVYIEDESHASTIVFPDFGIEKNLFPGSMGLIQISPTREGTFKFRCPMDRIRGELKVKNQTS